MTKNYDVVVVGAGSGGLTSAVGLARVGKKVLLVEREHLGGECTNSGCIPSKALLHYARSYHEAVTVAGQTETSETYRQQALQYVRGKIAEILAEETPEHFTKVGITVVIGEAVFTGKNTLTVHGETYTFKKAIIATGSSPRTTDIPGLTSDKILTNQNLFKLEAIPKDLLIIGGGPIGLEMGQAFAYLGTHVTIIENGDRFARLEDPEISPIIQKACTDLGITIYTSAGVERVEGNIAHVVVKGSTPEETKTIPVTFDQILLAIGRVPNIPAGLSEVGVTFDQNGITVNEKWQTSAKHIYALGDVAARLKFTHVADDTARAVVTHIASFGLLSPAVKPVPKVTFTTLEIAQVGLSETEAIALYGSDMIHRIEVPFNTLDRARTDNATSGLLIVIAKRLSGKILGAHIIGARAGELLGTVSLAITHNLSLYRLRSTIFAYPTYSLILKKAGDYFLAKHVATLKSDLCTITKKIAPKLIILLVWLLALYQLYTYKETYGLTTTELSLRLFEFITETAYAPLLYILAYAIRPITFFPGTILTILSGVFFGLFGILYTVIGANLSAALAYAVGRFFSSSKEPTGLLRTWTRPLSENPFLSILTMRLTFFPFDGVNYGAGLLRVPFLPYILATFVGTLLGIATFVSIGASLDVEAFITDGLTVNAIDAKFIILSVVIFLASLGIAKFLKK